MDHLVTHPKDAGVCLGVDKEHHQFQHITTPKPPLLCHVALLLHHYSLTPDPFICLIKILFPLSLSSQTCIQCYVALGLQRPIPFPPQCEAEVEWWYRNSIRKLCVCVCSF